MALQYALDDLKADKEFVMAALQQDCRELKYASKDLKADKEVVMAAVWLGASICIGRPQGRQGGRYGCHAA